MHFSAVDPAWNVGGFVMSQRRGIGLLIASQDILLVDSASPCKTKHFDVREVRMEEKGIEPGLA